MRLFTLTFLALTCLCTVALADPSGPAALAPAPIVAPKLAPVPAILKPATVTPALLPAAAALPVVYPNFRTGELPHFGWDDCASIEPVLKYPELIYVYNDSETVHAWCQYSAVDGTCTRVGDIPATSIRIEPRKGFYFPTSQKTDPAIGGSGKMRSIVCGGYPETGPVDLHWVEFGRN